LFGLGLSYLKMNKFSEATGPLTRVIEEYPRSDKWFMAHVMLGSTHDRNAEKSQALYILEKALSQIPPTAIRSMTDRLINLVHDEVVPMTS
jgi:TolA-binding protein|tara:strand:+ start:576 stop:848 length:273 start_codon:yes stop_codon:yes gene_type:complete